MGEVLYTARPFPPSSYYTYGGKRRWWEYVMLPVWKAEAHFWKFLYKIKGVS